MQGRYEIAIFYNIFYLYAHVVGHVLSKLPCVVDHCCLLLSHTRTKSWKKVNMTQSRTTVPPRIPLDPLSSAPYMNAQVHLGHVIYASCCFSWRRPKLFMSERASYRGWKPFDSSLDFSPTARSLELALENRNARAAGNRYRPAGFKPHSYVNRAESSSVGPKDKQAEDDIREGIF